MSYLVALFIIDKFGWFLSPSTGDPGMLAERGEASIVQGEIFVQLVGACIGIAAFFTAGPAFYRANLRRFWLLGVYFIILGFSVLYSQDAWISLRRFMGWTVVLVIGGSILAFNQDDRKNPLSVLYQFCIVYFGVALIALLRSVFIGWDFFSVPFAVFDAAHRDAEIIAIFLLLSWYFTVAHGKNMPATHVVQWILGGLLIVLTLSRTTMIGLFVAAGYMLIASSQRLVSVLSRAIALASVVMMVYLFSPSTSIETIARPESAQTMTGRTVLWDFLIASQVENIWIGSGVGSFWNPDRIYALQNIYGWGITGAHNGFLDVFFNTGFLGLSLLMLLLAHLWWKAGKLERSLCVVSRGLMIFIVMQNFAQGSFQNHRHFVEVTFWFLYLAVVFLSSEKDRVAPTYAVC